MESQEQKQNELPKIGAPATRALNGIGIYTLNDVAKHSEQDLLNMHGVGPKAIRILREHMSVAGLSFKAKQSENEANVTDREIIITRVFEAPRPLVWRAWTDPEVLPLWWGPEGFTNTTHEVYIREGGFWRFTMHGSDGSEYENVILYKEIIDQELIVFDHGEPGTPALFTTSVTFVDQGDKTEITFRMLFPTADDRVMAVEKFGAIGGANQTLDKLGEILTRIS